MHAVQAAASAKLPVPCEWLTYGKMTHTETSIGTAHVAAVATKSRGPTDNYRYQVRDDASITWTCSTDPTEFSHLGGSVTLTDSLTGVPVFAGQHRLQEPWRPLARERDHGDV